MSRTPTKATGGPVDNVKCPNCGRGNDFRDVDSQQLLDTGHTVACDHCQRLMQVKSIRMIKLVQVIQYFGPGQMTPRRRGQLPPPRQATTLSPAQTQRLLRGRR